MIRSLTDSVNSFIASSFDLIIFLSASTSRPSSFGAWLSTTGAGALLAIPIGSLSKSRMARRSITAPRPQAITSIKASGDEAIARRGLTVTVVISLSNGG